MDKIKKRKIFFIGYNKTATCSIHNLLINNGIKVQHNSNWNLKEYEAFCDCGDLNDFKNLYKLYPNAYFILNTRNIKCWLLSRLKHGYVYKLESFGYPKPSEELVYKWLVDRINYYTEVKQFFKDKDNFYILDIDDKEWKKKLGDILCLVNIDIDDKHISRYHEVYEEYKELIENVFKKI